LPTGRIAHVQVNDRNRRGPGEGEDRFAAVFATLKRFGYDGVVAVEPFKYVPDGPTCATPAARSAVNGDARRARRRASRHPGTRDPAGTRSRILDAATKEFARF